MLRGNKDDVFIWSHSIFLPLMMVKCYNSLIITPMILSLNLYKEAFKPLTNMIIFGHAGFFRYENVDRFLNFTTFKWQKNNWIWTQYFRKSNLCISGAFFKCNTKEIWLFQWFWWWNWLLLDLQHITFWNTFSVKVCFGKSIEKWGRASKPAWPCVDQCHNAISQHVSYHWTMPFGACKEGGMPLRTNFWHNGRMWW